MCYLTQYEKKEQEIKQTGKGSEGAFRMSFDSRWWLEREILGFLIEGKGGSVFGLEKKRVIWIWVTSSYG